MKNIASMNIYSSHFWTEFLIALLCVTLTLLSAYGKCLRNQRAWKVANHRSFTDKWSNI